MREIVLDTETTGLDPIRGDRLVELGCVELLNHRPTGATFHVYINPERDVPEEAFRIHGLSTEFLADKPKFSDVVADFEAFIGDANLVIHNASFDIKFLNAELDKVGRAKLGFNRVIDTLALARQKFPGSPVSLDALCNRFGISNAHRTKHGALLDSELLAEVYLDLLGLRQATLELVSTSREANGPSRVGENAAPVTRIRPQPLRPRVTPADIEQHKLFVQTLGSSALWKTLDGDASGHPDQ